MLPSSLKIRRSIGLGNVSENGIVLGLKLTDIEKVEASLA